MKYIIEITETLSRVVVVEADSAQDGLQRAQKAYSREQIVLDADDFICVDYKVCNDDPLLE